jgi:exodeoxyribonuclease VII large subunit
MRLTEREDKLERAVSALLTEKKNCISRVSAQMEALSPLSVLSRGYAAISKNGETVVSVKKIEEGDALEIRFADGSVRATADRKEKTNG